MLIFLIEILSKTWLSLFSKKQNHVILLDFQC